VNRLTVGVGDCKVSNGADSVLATYALGSCIAVAIYDPVAAVGGLLHFMLPESSLNPDKASQNPFMFADTGIPLLFHTAYGLGAVKRRLVVRVVGGAQVMDENGVFNIGKRNHLALRKILWKAGVMIHGEEIGGTVSRTVRLEVASGRFWIRGPEMVEHEIPMPADGKGERGCNSMS
jgi:chemotaxis protein CheD